MRARAVAVFGFGFALCIACAGLATEGDFASRLDAALAVRALRGAQVSVLVVSRDDGRALYAREPDRGGAMDTARDAPYRISPYLKGQASRVISTGQLSVLLRAHLQPINLVVFQDSTGIRRSREILSWKGLRA